MKRKIMSLLVALCLTLALFPAVPAAAAAPVNVTINGVPVQFNQDTGVPFIDSNGRTQVPLRAAMEAMGADVGWNNYDRAASVVRDGNCVIVPIGSNSVYLNGNQIPNNTSAQIIGGRTYLPIRIVAESLGGTVEWISESRTVQIQIDPQSGPVYFELLGFIGLPMSTVYSTLGYDCTEGWCGFSNGPSLVYEKLGVWFVLGMYGPGMDCENPKTYHHPQNQIYNIRVEDYPILTTSGMEVTGRMTVSELDDCYNEHVDLVYDAEESEYGPCYLVKTYWTDSDTGAEYELTHIWEGRTYPGSYTKSSYAVIWKN